MICIVYIDRNFQRPIGYVCILYFMNCKPELLCAAQPPHNVRLHNLQRIYAICPLLYNVQYTDIHTHCEAVNHLPYSMNQTLRSSENLFARAALERINRPEHDKDLSLCLFQPVTLYAYWIVSSAEMCPAAPHTLLSPCARGYFNIYCPPTSLPSRCVQWHRVRAMCTESGSFRFEDVRTKPDKNKMVGNEFKKKNWKPVVERLAIISVDFI